MGASSAYLTAVVAGAMTAGIGAASVLATPPDVTAEASARDVELAAEITIPADAITIPIINIGPTPGPLSILRQLSVVVGLDPLTAGLIQKAGNTYNLPGLDTLYGADTEILVQAVRQAGEYIDLGLLSTQGQTGSWELLGGVATSSSEVENSRNIHFRGLTGGSGGIGAALYGTLGDSPFDRDLTFLGSALNSSGNRTVGDFNGELALLPWDGFKVVGGGSAPPATGQVPTATLIDTNRPTTFNLGSLTGKAESTVPLDGGAGLCLGSAKASCGGNTAFARSGRPSDRRLGARQAETSFPATSPPTELSRRWGMGSSLSRARSGAPFRSAALSLDVRFRSTSKSRGGRRCSPRPTLGRVCEIRSWPFPEARAPTTEPPLRVGTPPATRSTHRSLRSGPPSRPRSRM